MSTRREIVKRALDFLAGLHSQEWDRQLPIGRQGRATEPAVKGKFFATGGKTKTGKEATLPPFVGPQQGFGLEREAFLLREAPSAGSRQQSLG